MKSLIDIMEISHVKLNKKYTYGTSVYVDFTVKNIGNFRLYIREMNEKWVPLCVFHSNEMNKLCSICGESDSLCGKFDDSLDKIYERVMSHKEMRIRRIVYSIC